MLLTKVPSDAGLRATAGRIGRDRSGLALIEFALALPVLLTISLTGIEVANLAVTVLRVNQLAMLGADNAARVRGSMDEQDVNQVMIGIRFAGTSIKFGQQGRVILSDLEANGQTGSNAGYKITWQRCFGTKNAASQYGIEGKGATNGDLATGVTVNGKTLTPVTNSALILAEIRYTYRPLVASAFMKPLELRSVQAFPVRERAGQALTNTTNLSDSAQRKCDAAHLSST